MQFKRIFNKLLQAIPDFPGTSTYIAEKELVDLKGLVVHKKTKRYLGWVILMLAFLLAFSLMWLNSIISATEYIQEKRIESKETQNDVQEEPLPVGVLAGYNFLVVGKEDDGRADTILLCYFDVKNLSLRVLSFPRDTRVLTAHNGVLVLDKISHAFRWGGIELLKHSVEEFLRVSIDHTIIIDLAIFRKIIDTIGGVEVEVEKDLKYRDNAQGLTIDLNKGLQVLDGKNAEGYVRYRSDGLGDLGRIERQKKFILAFVSRLKTLKLFGWESFKVLGRMPGFLMNLYSDVKTSIPIELFIKLLVLFGDVSKEDVAFKTMHGAGEYIPVPEYKKKINFFMSTKADILESRNWLLKSLESDFNALEQKEYFSQFKSLESSMPSMESITSADALTLISIPPLAPRT